jgi:hypothetical protein
VSFVVPLAVTDLTVVAGIGSTEPSESVAVSCAVPLGTVTLTVSALAEITVLADVETALTESEPVAPAELATAMDVAATSAATQNLVTKRLIYLTLPRVMCRRHQLVPLRQAES